MRKEELVIIYCVFTYSSENVWAGWQQRWQHAKKSTVGNRWALQHAFSHCHKYGVKSSAECALTTEKCLTQPNNHSYLCVYYSVVFFRIPTSFLLRIFNCSSSSTLTFEVIWKFYQLKIKFGRSRTYLFETAGSDQYGIRSSGAFLFLILNIL